MGKYDMVSPILSIFKHDPLRLVYHIAATDRNPANDFPFEKHFSIRSSPYLDKKISFF